MSRDGRRHSHELLEGYRFAAVKLSKAGVHPIELAKSFGVARETVYEWLCRAKQQGTQSLKSSKSCGRSPRVDAEIGEKLSAYLRKPATECGYSTDLWSGPRIRHLLKHRFGIVYHVKHLPRLLRRIGLILKFPERRALEQDPEAVRIWKQRELPRILRFTRKKRAILFYADESLISLIPYVGKTWALPNKTPIVRVSGKRGQHVGVTAAVNRGGRLCFELTREGERFTAKVFLRFIKKLRLEHPRRRIVLIVDGASTHTAKIVKAFEKEHQSRFSLEILPAYSPELNPTEQSWRFIKTKKLNGSTAKSKTELKTKARTTMRELKRDPKRVASFFA